MARKIIKRYMPTPETIRQHRSLSLVGHWLQDPHLWHLTRNSVSRAVAIGLFLAFIPLPTQMLMAVLCALWLRANVAIAVALVWITNPLTMPPIFYAAYRVGSYMMGASPGQEFSFDLSWEWLGHELASLWQPFLLGCFVCGSSAALIGYWLMQGFWRWHVIQRWRQRSQARQVKN